MPALSVQLPGTWLLVAFVDDTLTIGVRTSAPDRMSIARTLAWRRVA